MNYNFSTGYIINQNLNNLLGGNMDNNKLRYFKNRLLKEKREILRNLNNMNNMEEYGSMDVYYSELSNYDNHPADIGTELFMMEQDNGFKNKIKDTLNEIENSLNDIREGKYGICKKCNKEINEERLKLIPYLKRCMECAEDNGTISQDFISNRKFVPIAEEDGTSFSDIKENMVEFDREDSYQQVASYNIVSDDPSFATGDDLGIMDEKEGDGVEEIENISQEYYDETLE